MKKLLLAAALLIASTQAIPGEPTVFERLEACTVAAVKSAEYTLYAQHSASLDDYKVIIDKEIAAQSNAESKKFLMLVANVAWQHKGEDATGVAMNVYAECKAEGNAGT